MKDRLRLVYRKFRKTVLILVIAQLVYILALRWIDPPFTITQLGNWVSGNGLKRDYVNFEDMSPNIRLAVMASEDQLFPRPQWV
jgi:monofunctional biosynthetic peptidoglycan transglycosylase